ncbi:hypothetical protein BRD17_00065, partial [Halobacteriales archaeon SW_7_68_16]
MSDTRSDTSQGGPSQSTGEQTAHESTRGASNALAVGLAVALVVLAAAGAGIYLFVFDTAEGAPDVAFTVDETETTLTYQHEGGDPLPIEKVETRLAVGGQSTRLPLSELDETACVRRVAPSNGTVTAGGSVRVNFEPYCTENNL